MKKKDVVYAVLAGAILLVAGYLAYTLLVPKKTGSQSSTVTVEKIGVIADKFDENGTNAIKNSLKVVDYNLLPDYTGLGNPAPFGP